MRRFGKNVKNRRTSSPNPLKIEPKSMKIRWKIETNHSKKPFRTKMRKNRAKIAKNSWKIGQHDPTWPLWGAQNPSGPVNLGFLRDLLFAKFFFERSPRRTASLLERPRPSKSASREAKTLPKWGPGPSQNCFQGYFWTCFFDLEISIDFL